jgi:hypothetical protein
MAGRKPKTQWRATKAEEAGGEEITLTPYMHWWLERQAPDHQPLSVRSPPCAAALCPDGEDAPIKEVVPLPDFAWNPMEGPHGPPTGVAAKTDKPPKDAVIIGVIDEGIALAHERVRLANGQRSRIIAAWQQGGRFGGPDGSTPQDLPFGHELYQSDINTLMDTHSHAGWLDEDAFNRAAGLTEMHYPMGANALERVIAHGSHVMDLAAGEDANEMEPKRLARMPIIAVNLPRRETIGMAGTFLQFFVLHAMQRIVDLADAMWAEHYPDDPDGGFPVVINLSFGQHAGPKNGTSQIEQAFARLTAGRDKKSPVRLVIPAGNGNLSRGNAIAPIAKEATVEMPWRMLPEDQSSNFVELWVELDGDVASATHPVIVTLTAPSGQVFGPFQGQDGHHTDVFGAMRIYAEKLSRLDDDPPHGIKKTLYRYVICAAPTLDYHTPLESCQAGLWQVACTWDETGFKTAERPVLYGMVQVDQAAQPGSLRNKRSFFDAQGYQLYDPTGRRGDAYAYPAKGDASDDLEPEATMGPVQRKGTHNALASAPEVIVVAGHRESDGRPADYSAATYAPERQRYGAAPTVTASFPTERAPAHFGLRAAGPRSAATILLRGTSFAAGLVTRHVVSDLLAWRDANSPEGGTDGSPRSIAEQAAAHEATTPYQGPAAAGKVGAGRMPNTPLRRVDRLTWGA